MNRRRAVAVGGLAAALTAAALLGAQWLWRPVDVPGFEAVRGAWSSSDALLLDRHGRILDRRRIDLGARRLDWVPLDAVSPALARAVVHSEDRRFHRHHGVDWRSLAGAVIQRLTSGTRRGASTISMQLAALIEPDLRADGRTAAYKLRQMRMALAMERTWTKAQILEAYLNLTGYRGELVGIDAAARLLLGKAPSGLDRRESLLLAALLPAPAAAPARVAARACAMDPSMACGAMETLAEQTLARPSGTAPDEALAPHLARRLLTRPGARQRTTLDADVQRLAIRALARHVGNARTRNVRDGAVLVADRESGDVLAYVAANAATSTAPHVDGIRALRQAGSTLKPFLYALALERGYLTAASLLEDTPVNLETGSGLYIPQNYDRDFKGLVSMRTALASSLNVPAVRTLVLTGIEPFRQRLVAAGYADIDRDADYYGYALALGSAEVSLWQQVTAYRTLARGGVRSPLRLLPDDAGPELRAMNAGAAAIVTDVLSDRAARLATFGLDNHLATPIWSAVKTGTSKDMRDNWCIGFSSRYVVGVWVGNFEGDSMHDVSGVTGAAPVWQEVISALEGAPAAPPPPPGVVAVRMRFEPPVEPERLELFLAGTESGVSRALPASGLAVKITSPANGMIAALDPDIPAHRQRIPFSARGATDGLRFVLDGEPLGPARQTFYWQPTPGPHRLAVAATDGAVMDQVLITVR